MIPSLLPLTIHCWCLCMATRMPDLILAGRSRRLNGVPCSSGSSRENHSVTLHMSMACRMRQSGVYNGRHVATQWSVAAQISRNRRYNTRRLHKQSMGEASPKPVPGASDTLAVYHSRVQQTWESPGQRTGARREADVPHGVLNCPIDRQKAGKDGLHRRISRVSALSFENR